MISSYVILYQYFDAQELKLEYEIRNIKQHRKMTVEDLQEIIYLQVKLDFVRKIEKELLQIFYKL